MTKITFTYAVLLFFGLTAVAQPNFPTQPQEAQLVYTDLENFVEAMAQFTTDADTLAVLQDHYFAKATPGLEEYIRRHELTPQMLMAALKEAPEEYQKIPAFLKEMDTYQTAYRAALAAYQAVIPQAMFPPTYLLVGANRGIAQASRVGQLVTMIRRIDSFDKTLTTILHELTHFQQAFTLGFNAYSSTYKQPDNMLDLILREGAADFIAMHLVRHKEKESARLQYLEAHEAVLFDRFQKDLAKQDKSFWLWESINQNKVPILLGYAMGYKICEAYYHQAADKTQAIKDILGISDAAAFFKQSGYHPK